MGFFRPGFGNLEKKPVCFLRKFQSTECDKVPWLWEVMERNGYVTSYIDEFCDCTATRDLVPFSDHPFQEIFCKSYSPRRDGVQYEVDFDAGKELCLAGERQSTHFYRYAIKFLKAYPDIPKFVVISMLEAHAGSQLYAAQHLDEDTLWFLQKITPMLTDSMLIVFSDHGSYTETMLPFLSITLPSWLLKKNPEMEANLRQNQLRVVSPYDFYQTITHLITYPKPYYEHLEMKQFNEIVNVEDPNSPKYLQEEVYNAEMNRIDKKEYRISPQRIGHSLFTPLPEHRTCENVDIQLENCQLNVIWKTLDLLELTGEQARQQNKHYQEVVIRRIEGSVLTLWDLVQETMTFLNDASKKERGVCQLLTLWTVERCEIYHSNHFVVAHLNLQTKTAISTATEFTEKTLEFGRFDARFVIGKTNTQIELAKIIQLTTYQPHKTCNPPDVPAEYCFCQRNTSNFYLNT